MNGRRLAAFGIAMVFVSSTRALEAVGVEDALPDCLVAAVVATLLTAAWPSA